MPKNKDLKKRVRARMEKTGESYTTARSQVVRKKAARKQAGAPARVPVAQYATLAGMSDEAVAKKTGRTWKQWVQLLDREGAAGLEHKHIARGLQGDHGLSAWWAQTVTVGYERIRGLRDVGQRRGGGYDVNKSKTVPVPVAELYAAFGARGRRRWLGEVGLKVKTATPSKSMRITWEDGSPLDLYFLDKGASKSAVQLQHREHATKAQADARRAYWTEQLAELGRYLKQRSERGK